MLDLGLMFSAMFASATVDAGEVMQLPTINHIFDGAVT